MTKYKSLTHHTASNYWMQAMSAAKGRGQKQIATLAGKDDHTETEISKEFSQFI